MGRSKKPLSQQTGHLTRETQDLRTYEESLIVTRRDDLPRIPPEKFIDPAAREEYDRILPQLLDNDILGDLDRNNVIVYCNTWSEIQKLTEDLKWEEHFMTDNSGRMYENPKLKASRDAYKQLMAAAEKLGMTINGRLNAAALKAKQEQDKLQEEFGDI